MEKNLPLLLIFLGFFLVTGLAFWAAWAFWLGPGRIRAAVRQRQGPSGIRAATSASVVYWLLVSLLALAVSGLAAYLAWRCLGWWLYAAAGGWKDQFAMALSQTWLVFLSEEADYKPFLPLGAVLGVLAGVLAGAWAGTWGGVRVAARQFLITRAMF